MLILDRKPGTTFFINTPNGDRISITCLKSSNYTARIGIAAPKEYNIVREELLTRDGDTSAAFEQIQASGHMSSEQIALDQQEALGSLKQGQRPSSLDGGQRSPGRIFKSY